MKKFFVIIFFVISALVVHDPIFSQQLLLDNEWKLVAEGFQFPEGPAWDGDNSLYFSNCYGGWIGKISDGKVDTFAISTDESFTKTNGIIVKSSGEIIVCEYGFGKILSFTSEGNFLVMIDGFKGKSFNRPNDIIIDVSGNLYFSDPKGYGKENPEGRLFYYNFSTKTLDLVAESLDFPNGIAISPKTKKLYLSESGKNRILEFKIENSGNLRNKKVFIDLPGGDPDGLDFDIEGNLYVPHFGTGTLYVISPVGKVLQKMKTPGLKPSNIEFGDKDLKTLYLTEDETNSIYKIRTKYEGYKLS